MKKNHQINYPLILDIIYSFYDVAKKDILIGYHFRFITDFDEHIPRIADFWNLQINGQLENRQNLPFNLLAPHKAMRINKGEVFRWEKLFNEILENYLSEDKIDHIQKDYWMGKVEIFKLKILAFI